MDQHASDEHVMAQLIQGDESALGVLMGRWAGPMRCFIDRMCGSLHATDDICQEIWTRVFAYRRRYMPARPFRGYLFKVAINCCRSALRQRMIWRQVMVNPDSNLDLLPAPPDQPTIDAMIAEEHNARLRRAISFLPERQRAVVLLYVLFDTDYSRIAGVLEISAGTVRSNMHHALRKLRSTLNRISQDSQREVDHERQTR